MNLVVFFSLFILYNFFLYIYIKLKAVIYLEKNKPVHVVYWFNLFCMEHLEFISYLDEALKPD